MTGVCLEPRLGLVQHAKGSSEKVQFEGGVGAGLLYRCVRERVGLVLNDYPWRTKLAKGEGPLEAIREHTY